jgi:hypothetical protein
MGQIVRLLSVVTVLALFAQAPDGVFEIELWPGEGRPQFQAVSSELALRESPTTSGRIVQRLNVSSGQDIAFDETRYRTTEPGHVQVLAASSIAGRLLGQIRSLTRTAYYTGQFPPQSVAVKAGDVIEYLQDRAEGACFVRVANQVIDADPCPTQDDRAFRLTGEPKIEWWIRVVVGRAPVGWVMVDENVLTQSGRSF